jgi:DNA modification methylase
MESKQLSELKGNPTNPRTINKVDFENLKKSIKEFGDLSGIVLNIRTGQLVGGHQRVEAFKSLGGQSYVNIQERLTDATHKGTIAYGYVLLDGERYGYREVDWEPTFELAANIAANRITGQFDQDLLAEVTYQIQQENESLLALTGQTDAEISKLLDMVGVSSGEEDEAPEVDDVNPPISKLGEVYQLGKHRLMCGSSTDINQVNTLINGTKIDMVFTDPPYNAAFNGRSGNHDVIMNDELPEAEFTQFITDFFGVMYKVAPECAKYICTDWKMYPLIYSLMESPNACIVWVKNMFGMGNTYRHQHELIVFEGKLEANDQSDVWEIKRDNGADYDHPTQKPVELFKKAIINSSLRSGAVLDFFSGSGSGLIACEIADRTFLGMELDPKYCDVIRKRYAKHISQDHWIATTPVISTYDFSIDQTATNPQSTFTPPEIPEQ